MNIVIINGSPRKNGSTAYILHNLEKNLKQEGANVSYYDLCDKTIAPCKGCCVCYKTGKCIMNDDAEKISHDISMADGVIIGSSTIASNVTGVLKTFIDRGHFVIEQLLKEKYALCVATYENYGGKDTKNVLKKLLTYSGAYLSGAITIKLPFNSEYSKNSSLNIATKKYANKLYNDIKYKHNYTFQKLKHRAIFEFGIKPFVIKKGNQYYGVQKRWSEIGLN